MRGVRYIGQDGFVASITRRLELYASAAAMYGGI